ncbi:MAG: hypothetical protein KDD64_16705, partial [Bdellovibrionales bacterium]|nr:hypothetical protein [Bdellovibrionales bacterium]
PYVNYVQASESVLAVNGAITGFDGLLKDYPRVEDGTFGEIYFDRVVQGGTSLSSHFCRIVDETLDTALRSMGSQYECNIIVYPVATSDIGFYEALRVHWQNGNKNDIVVCIGYLNNSVQWCRVMAWTDHKLFLEKLETRVRELETLEGKGELLAATILDQIRAPGDAGYLRKPMADYAFLASDIRMPLWAYLILVPFAWLMSLTTVWLFIHD